MTEQGFINQALVYLAAAVIAVPISRRLGLGSVLGFLIAGAAIGPWGLRLIPDPATVLQFAEIGVVLLLFLVGLELDPRRLWALRRPIFGHPLHLALLALTLGPLLLAHRFDTPVLATPLLASHVLDRTGDTG